MRRVLAGQRRKVLVEEGTPRIRHTLQYHNTNTASRSRLVRTLCSLSVANSKGIIMTETVGFIGLGEYIPSFLVPAVQAHPTVIFGESRNHPSTCVSGSTSYHNSTSRALSTTARVAHILNILWLVTSRVRFDLSRVTAGLFLNELLPCFSCGAFDRAGTRHEFMTPRNWKVLYGYTLKSTRRRLLDRWGPLYCCTRTLILVVRNAISVCVIDRSTGIMHRARHACTLLVSYSSGSHLGMSRHSVRKIVYCTYFSPTYYSMRAISYCACSAPI